MFSSPALAFLDDGRKECGCPSGVRCVHFAGKLLVFFEGGAGHKPDCYYRRVANVSYCVDYVLRWLPCDRCSTGVHGEVRNFGDWLYRGEDREKAELVFNAEEAGLRLGVQA